MTSLLLRKLIFWHTISSHFSVFSRHNNVKKHLRGGYVDAMHCATLHSWSPIADMPAFDKIANHLGIDH